MNSEVATINTDAIRAAATGFLARAEEVRAAIADVLYKHPYAAAAAIIAGQFAIEESMTDLDKANILKCVTKGKLKIEGGGRPVDTKIFEVVAEAAAKQLRFGTDDYSVWTNGTLYIKEGGYRHLLSQRPGVSRVDINPDIPAWHNLQGSKAGWIVPGEASAEVNGKRVTIQARVLVNGNATDNPAKIEAHASRALAKRLWKMLSAVDMEPDDSADIVVDDSQSSVNHVAMQPVGTMNVTLTQTRAGLPPSNSSTEAIEAIPSMSERRKQCLNERKRSLKMVSADPSEAATFQEIWDAFANATSCEELRGKGMEYKPSKAAFSKQVQDSLTKWFYLRQDEISQGVEVPDDDGKHRESKGQDTADSVVDGAGPAAE